MSSSQVSIPKDTVSSTKELTQVATDLTDKQAIQITEIALQVQRRYAKRLSSPKNLEEMRDEILTRLAEINILATVDPTPVFYGEPPVLEIIGEVNATNDGMFDHERKQKEVLEAKALGEDFRGQKEKHKG
jgi:hypothetical protein